MNAQLDIWEFARIKKMLFLPNKFWKLNEQRRQPLCQYLLAPCCVYVYVKVETNEGEIKCIIIKSKRDKQDTEQSNQRLWITQQWFLLCAEDITLIVVPLDYKCIVCV